ncbi:MAG: 3-keto-5-aminohexanoate cleavage protein [Acidobacteria bacterium]|nr:3-keto-5-aminohexanoate cleavage protein [Acidobacteriota bacterium]
MPNPEQSQQRPWFKYTNSYEFMERVRVGLPPVIICVACNGGIQGKEANEAIPETADEIARSVQDAYEAGASMVHIHARDPKQLTLGARDPDTWREVLHEVRSRCPEIIINATTGAGPGMTMEERASSLAATPEVASLNLAPDMSQFKLKQRAAPLPFPRPAQEIDECIPFTYGQIHQFAAEMKRRGIKPELELYHPGCAWVVRYLIEHDLLEKPYWVQTVMGYQTSSFPTVENVLQILKELPEDSLWLCSAIGPFQLPLTTLATLMGGHVRVGLEDNIYYSRGRKARNNAELVDRAARIAKELNREVATPAQARKMLGLRERPSPYYAAGDAPAHSTVGPH